VNDSKGLKPSEYAGGGSVSSSFLEDSALLSRGNAALVSATASNDDVDDKGLFEISGANGAYAGTEAELPASVTAVLYASTACSVETYRDEKGGGRGDGGGEEEDASDRGYVGGGD
jgi:hypothetical protein